MKRLKMIFMPFLFSLMSLILMCFVVLAVRLFSPATLLSADINKVFVIISVSTGAFALLIYWGAFVYLYMDNDYNSNLKKISNGKAPELLTWIELFKKNYVNDLLLWLAILAVPTIIYSFNPSGNLVSMIFAAANLFYTLTSSAVLGLLLNTVLFTLVSLLAAFLSARSINSTPQFVNYKLKEAAQNKEKPAKNAWRNSVKHND